MVREVTDEQLMKNEPERTTPNINEKKLRYAEGIRG
jgi:hypothetical protein